MAAAEAPDILAIIPARGGSRGIPGKNLREVGGKPLIAHTIEQALASPEITRVVVSTDDGEIARVSESYGAEVVARPAEISGDEATSESALLHVLETLQAREGYLPQLVVFLQCTSPLRGSDDVSGAIRHLRGSGADSLLSVIPFHVFIWQLVDGVPRALDYDYRERPRRQDRLPEYQETGSIYVFKPWVLLEQNNRLGGTVALYEMEEWTALDINTPQDLELCEHLLAGLGERREQGPS
jgi:CMP-N,N'-diacetyllegionaminic acid synthase